MTSNTPSEAANAQQLTSAIYEVSCFNQTFDLKGWIEISNIEPSNVEMILKKRGTDFYYTIPYEWLDDTHWRAAFDIAGREITKGT